MKEIRMERIAERVRAKGHGRHSDAYRWLLERHGAIAEMLSEHKPSWRVMAEEIAEAGVRGARGQVMAGRYLRRMWTRVCRDVARAAEEKRTEASTPKKPSRYPPAGWMPPLADPPRPFREREAPRALTGSDLDDEPLPPHVREQLDQLQDQFDYTDRFVRPRTVKD